ncbi:TrgA family protein [Pseudosulfitobacter koreensis]|uniref:TrgA family protein n=1 Tax=Pseudosulfitobacter koreensis TaxID=2968472 RepID=A0ABT1Z0G1_9RHOB|nr:TrgA family protein [Pseudosulfitobacter koreense]MCR8826621.1 TrgA family protein [Pseudosulfitobacter koreense]
MPDAARLVAALSMALLAFIVSAQIVPLMPESTDFGYFYPVNIVLAALVGWLVMGRRAGRGVTSAVNNGLTGMLVFVLWGLFIQGCNEMIRLAMRNRYDDPFEAIVAIFEIGAEYGLIMLVPLVIGTLIAGGVLAGLATEVAWRKWR